MSLTREELAELDTCLCLAARRTARAITRAYDRALAPLGITSTQLPVLTAIATWPGIATAPLADGLVMDPSSLQRTVGRLVDAGLVQRTPGEDRRTRVLHLTDAGQALLVDALPQWRAAQDRVAAALESIDPTFTPDGLTALRAAALTPRSKP